MVELRHHQLLVWERWFPEQAQGWWEEWMRQADQVLDDDELLEAVYHAQGKRRPKSHCRGRKQTPAEVLLRLAVLKHVRNWSFEETEREVRANVVYSLHVEANTHYPTDSSLLSDGARVLTRTMKEITALTGRAGTNLRNRMRTIGHRAMEIACLSGEKHPGCVLYGRQQGRRFSLYVPEELVPQVQRWLDNGRALQELLYQAASRKLQALKLERDQASKKTEDCRCKDRRADPHHHTQGVVSLAGGYPHVALFQQSMKSCALCR
jgi:hypothetical protein